jgi:hypothetical protein
MILRCINDKAITIETPFEILLCENDDLVYGQNYKTANSEPYLNENCIFVYDVEGIGERLACRFNELI